MKTFVEHVEHIKGKPHHVRKRFAHGAAAVITGLIALVWLGSSLAFGRFALPSTSFADSTNSNSVIATGDVSTPDTGFAGVASAFSDPQLAKIQIVTVATSSTVAKQTEQTVIPF